MSEAELTELIQTIALQERNLEIRADSAARHGDVVRILDLAKRLDLDRIGIAVDSASDAPRMPVDATGS